MFPRDSQPKTIYLKDYQPPAFLIDETRLRIELGDVETLVHADLSLRRNPAANAAGPLVLQGEGLSLRSLAIDGRELGADEYRYANGELQIDGVAATLQLKSTVAIKPQDNTSLEGLYRSRTMYCTQCEAEGFRKITFYLDRPDVMAEFYTTVVADKDRYPILLANGNPVDRGELPGNRHWVTWHDPFRKPAYLFAMVAGDLACVDDSYATMSGREVALKIYVETKDVDKCAHAMTSLKHAMAWDERVYGREYDLDIFMIVAVDDFNMGAMENKGLNIFNTSCVLAHPATTTDAAFQRVEAVVAHEYFHNWSGNRVTCRDWFQLSLKEGFTVFRDAQFSADMGSPTVRRVETVNLLRTLQFAEDGGPTAHPVQPAAFMEIANFYTLTIYEKGAEVVRMIRNLLGPDLFRKGTDLYFARHDGQAVTIEDFVAAMAEVSGRDFRQFMRWYCQAGTPRLAVGGHHDAATKTYRLEVRQFCPPTPEAAVKAPFHIPLRMGLVGRSGDLPLVCAGVAQGQTDVVLEITEPVQDFVFEGIAESPIPSLLRDFSAPVKLAFDYSRDELLGLLSRDSDGFNRWEAGHRLAVDILQELIAMSLRGEPLRLDERLIEAFRLVLSDASLDKAMAALMLSLPTEAYLAELAEVIEVAAIHDVRQFVRRALAEALQPEFVRVYDDNLNREPYCADAGQIARRSLKNTALGYLLQSADGDSDVNAVALAERQFRGADNMTDAYAALNVLVNHPGAQARQCAQRALADYYRQWQHEPLVVNQWFQVQAWCILPGGLERVRELMRHPAFDLKNPNKVRALIGAFSAGNPLNFHRDDGAGYRFLADQVLSLDRLNPQVAARLVTPLTRWRKYPPRLAPLMRAELERLRTESALSRDVDEIVGKSLA